MHVPDYSILGTTPALLHTENNLKQFAIKYGK